MDNFRDTLHDSTIMLLRKRPHDTTLNDIATATGLSRAFVKGVAEGSVAHPSVNGVQRIYEYLSGRKLVV